MSKRKIRIELDCLRIKLLGGLVILQQRVGISRDLVRAQIKHVRIGVLRRFRGNPCFFLLAERRPERVGNFAR